MESLDAHPVSASEARRAPSALLALAVEARLPSGPRFPEHWLIVLIFLASLAHGLTYVFMMPPWQHYEEPSHFEYAWLIAQANTLPTYPAYDQTKRREIAASMIQHGFFRDLGFLPDLGSQDAPIWIGVNVTGAVPLYHILAGLPFRLFSRTPVTFQLYAARLVSLMLYLLTIGLSFCLVAELTPPGHLLRWRVPLSIALLPGFTDLMTAVNNDVGATFVFSLYLWATVRMVRRGCSLPRLLSVVGTAALCLWTKNTVLVALPLIAVAVSLSLWSRSSDTGLAAPVRTHHNWLKGTIAWGTIALVGLGIALVAVFSWGDAALWYRDTSQDMPTRVRVAASQAPLGQHAVGLTITPNLPRAAQLKQPLTREDLQIVRGRTVTVGAWMWATTPVTAQSPGVFDGRQFVFQAVTIGPLPSFHSVRATIPDDAKYVHVILQPGISPEVGEAVTVYYDGVVLAEGEWPSDHPPVFANAQGDQGMWLGRPFVNRARNASAERGWPWVRPWAENRAKQLAEAHLSPSTLLASLLDWRNTAWYYPLTLTRVFETFLGRFGWAQVALPSGWYGALWGVTLLGCFGAGVRLWRTNRNRSRSWNLALVWLGLASLSIWAGVMVRGLFTVLDENPYIPTARYGYPVIIPTIMLLTAGWGTIGNRLGGLQHIIYLIGSLALDLASIWTIMTFYSGG